MRYYRPDIILPQDYVRRPSLLARLVGRTSPPSAPAHERLGGRPWGLDPAVWPKCADCGASQTLLAQFRHHPERLDLGREGRMMFVFMCEADPGMCDTYIPGQGANACLVVEPEALSDGATPLPHDSPTVLDEVLIIGWAAQDDGIDAAQAAAFGSADTLDPLRPTLPWDTISSTTGLGGVPAWCQNPESVLIDNGWRFVGQIADTHRFLRPPRTRRAPVRVETCASQTTFWVDGPNLGDAGMAYIFLKDGGDCPSACMTWQCH